MKESGSGDLDFNLPLKNIGPLPERKTFDPLSAGSNKFDPLGLGQNKFDPLGMNKV